MQEGMGKGREGPMGPQHKVRILHSEVTLVYEEACEHITIHIFLHYVT